MTKKNKNKYKKNMQKNGMEKDKKITTKNN